MIEAGKKNAVFSNHLLHHPFLPPLIEQVLKRDGGLQIAGPSKVMPGMFLKQDKSKELVLSNTAVLVHLPTQTGANKYSSLPRHKHRSLENRHSIFPFFTAGSFSVCGTLITIYGVAIKISYFFITKGPQPMFYRQHTKRFGIDDLQIRK